MLQWDLLTILAILSVFFSLYVLGQSFFRAPAKGLDQRMQEFADQAVKLAQSDYQLKLDYSMQSLANLDRILEKIHLSHRDSPISERELSRIVLTWGGYLGVVLKKHFGGDWYPDSPTAGANTYPLRCKEQEAVPVMWCLHRIRRSQYESIVFKTDEFLKAIGHGSLASQ